MYRPGKASPLNCRGISAGALQTATTMEEEISKKKIIYGIVTVSDKGQIAIPVELRSHLDIKRGDQLVVLRKEDDSGLTLVKIDRMEDLLGGLRT